jgi:hypothetical protein
MRTLNFAGDTKEYFNLIYEGLAATQTRGADTRILSKVFIKMEDIGTPKPNVPLFVLEQDGIIKLEEAEFELVKKLLDTVEWNGLGARKAGQVMVWLADIKEDSITLEK